MRKPVGIIEYRSSRLIENAVYAAIATVGIVAAVAFCVWLDGIFIR